MISWATIRVQLSSRSRLRSLVGLISLRAIFAGDRRPSRKSKCMPGSISQARTNFLRAAERQRRRPMTLRASATCPRPRPPKWRSSTTMRRIGLPRYSRKAQISAIRSWSSAGTRRSGGLALMSILSRQGRRSRTIVWRWFPPCRSSQSPPRELSQRRPGLSPSARDQDRKPATFRSRRNCLPARCRAS